MATWRKLMGERQVQQARARRAAAAGHPHIGRLDVQVAQPARMHLRQRLRTGEAGLTPWPTLDPNPDTGRLDVQVTQPARMHLRHRLRARGSGAQALAYPRP